MQEKFYIMSEKLCLQWNDFQDNVKSSFGNLRDCTDFNDVTLACEDGQQIEAHKVILAASSPFFKALLKKNQHSHPLIYMRGMKSVDLVAIVDFLYYGEANIFQEDLDSFLSIAEELQLKGLKGSNAEEDWKGTNTSTTEEAKPKQERSQMTHIASMALKDEPTREHAKTAYNENTLVLPSTANFSGDLMELDEIVKSKMGTSENMTLDGGRQVRGKICKVCGKEGQSIDIKRHIEANHLEGVSLPCNQCDKTFRSRDAVRQHVSRRHKY